MKLFEVNPNNMAEAHAHFAENLGKGMPAAFYLQNKFLQLSASREAFMPASEIKRMDGFQSEKRAGQFPRSRWLLRVLLGEFLKTPPAEVEIIRLRSGKPVIEPSKNPLKIDFNLSHTEDITFIGFACDVSIGVDVEMQVPKENKMKIAERFYQPGEVKWLEQSIDDKEQETRFFRLWTMKEAVIKAYGGGVFQNIAQISFEEHQGSLRLNGVKPPWSDTKRWELHEIREVPRHACSVALLKD